MANYLAINGQLSYKRGINSAQVTKGNGKQNIRFPQGDTMEQ